MKFADSTGALTWAEMGWSNPKATRRVASGWVDDAGFSTAEERAEWDRLLAEEAAQKAHEEFLLDAQRKAA